MTKLEAVERLELTPIGLKTLPGVSPTLPVTFSESSIFSTSRFFSRKKFDLEKIDFFWSKLWSASSL